MFKSISKKLTKNNKEIPLLYIMFDLEKFQSQGEKGSCVLNLHPSLREDEILVEQLNSLVDHIRENHDMEKLI